MSEKLIECLDALIAADTKDGSLQLAQATFLPALREALQQAALQRAELLEAYLWEHPTASYGGPARQLSFNGDNRHCPEWTVTPLWRQI